MIMGDPKTLRPAAPHQSKKKNKMKKNKMKFSRSKCPEEHLLPEVIALAKHLKGKWIQACPMCLHHA